MATSEKDQAVLESIFNPLLPLGDIVPKHEVENENEINVENTEESKRAKDLETSGVEKAEQGDLEGALECFNEACEICPSRSSCFNNRAQLWRLKGSFLEVFASVYTKWLRLIPVMGYKQFPILNIHEVNNRPFSKMAAENLK